jgi:hypothetical protein
MTGFVNKLGLNSRSKASRNVWLTSLFNFFLLGMNYMRLIVPEEIFVILTLGLSLFGFISLIAYIYLTIEEWSWITGDKRIGKYFI